MFRPPNYIVWSTDRVDLSDPFQRRWYLQQVLTHGRLEDISASSTWKKLRLPCQT
jgi:hypothetical protein